MTARPLTRSQLARRIRQHVEVNLFDESGVDADGIALYALADPRDIRQTRYVGQTSLPQRRLLQHLNTARLWTPDADERPWWIKDPKLRPLYDWIRALYRDECRLPTMVVFAWVSVAQARAAERASIYEAITRRLPLLNVEAERGGAQLQLL